MGEVMFKRTVYATDGSARAHKTLAYAREIARGQRSQKVIQHTACPVLVVR